MKQAVLDEAARLAREGIDAALWSRLKKGLYGSQVRGLNSFDNLCVSQAQAFFAGRNLLDFAALFDQLEKGEAEAMLARWATPERTALSVVRPKGDAALD